jgi:hypothetical protein
MLVNAAKSAGLIDPLIVCEAVGALIGAEFEVRMDRNSQVVTPPLNIST